MNGTHRLGIVLLGLTLGVGLGTPSAVAGSARPSDRVANSAGPAVLYAGPARAPQWENTGIWRAAPIGVCTSSAYRAGEYVHQGCVYDDEGGASAEAPPIGGPAASTDP